MTKNENCNIYRKLFNYLHNLKHVSMLIIINMNIIYCINIVTLVV